MIAKQKTSGEATGQTTTVDINNNNNVIFTGTIQTTMRVRESNKFDQIERAITFNFDNATIRDLVTLATKEAKVRAASRIRSKGQEWIKSNNHLGTFSIHDLATAGQRSGEKSKERKKKDVKNVLLQLSPADRKLILEHPEMTDEILARYL